MTARHRHFTGPDHKCTSVEADLCPEAHATGGKATPTRERQNAGEHGAASCGLPNRVANTSAIRGFDPSCPVADRPDLGNLGADSRSVVAFPHAIAAGD